MVIGALTGFAVGWVVSIFVSGFLWRWATPFLFAGGGAAAGAAWASRVSAPCERCQGEAYRQRARREGERVVVYRCVECGHEVLG